MKTLLFKFRDRIKTRKLVLTATACLFTSVLTSSATITVQGWWHLDNTQPITDSSGNGRNFGSAYSTSYTGGGEVGLYRSTMGLEDRLGIRGGLALIAFGWV